MTQQLKVIISDNLNASFLFLNFSCQKFNTFILNIFGLYYYLSVYLYRQK